MKPAVDNGFGYIAVQPVAIRTNGGLLLPETGGMSAARIALVLQGAYKGQYVLYRTHTEVRAVYKAKPFVLIPEDACLSIVELEEHETAEPIIEVDIHVGKDRAWYGGEYRSCA